MGNADSNMVFSQKYSFFQTFYDKNFGHCRIYKQNQTNIQYVQLVQRYFSRQKMQILQENLECFRNSYFHQEEFPFLRVIEWKNKPNALLNAKFMPACHMLEVEIYIEFLRHNLREFLEWRKSEQRPLSYDEIIMALSLAVKAFSKTKNQIIGISLDLEDISVTVGGQIKFNPLTSNFFQSIEQQGLSSSFLKIGSSIQQKILNKKTFKSLYINCQKNQQLLISSQQSQFLSQIKKFANQLVWDSRHYLFHSKNPEEFFYDQKKSIKRLLAEVHRAKSIKQLKRTIGKTSLRNFYVQFQKIKHEESQARFQRLTSELSQKSEQTDSSRHQLFTGKDFTKYGLLPQHFSY